MPSGRLAMSKHLKHARSNSEHLVGRRWKQASRWKKVAVVFKNSKLTRLMQCYLVGHSKTSIIIAVSNDPTQFQETQNSLKFASTCQNQAESQAGSESFVRRSTRHTKEPSRFGEPVAPKPRKPRKN